MGISVLLGILCEATVCVCPAVPKRGASLEDWVQPAYHRVSLLTVLKLHSGRHVTYPGIRVMSRKLYLNIITG